MCQLFILNMPTLSVTYTDILHIICNIKHKSAENKSDENWEKIVRLGCSFHVEFSSQVITMYKESHRIQEEIANFFVNYLINLLI